MKKLYGLLALLLVSEALGLFLGHVFFGLFEKTVPAAVLTSFNRGTAHAAFVAYGAAAGLPVFALGLLAAGAARFFTGRRN